MNNSDNEILYIVEAEKTFDDEVERFVRKKRFRKLPKQIKALIEELRHGNFSGTLLTHRDKPVTYDVYKKRLPNEDTQVGTSNGYRIIYLAIHETHVVALLLIYYKKEQESLSDNYIADVVEWYFSALEDARM